MTQPDDPTVGARRGRPKGPEKVPTTIRLPPDVHKRLRRLALDTDETLEAIVLNAIRREFERHAGVVTRHIEMPDRMDPLLAEVFLQSLPSFCVIKRQDLIVWANLFFLDRFDRSLEDVRGRTLVDAGLVEGELAIDTVRRNIAEALKRRRAQKQIEVLKLKNLGSTSVRTFRFKFYKERYLGDFSFIEKDIRDRDAEDMSALARMSRLAAPEPALQELFVPLLKDAPLAIALKRWRDDSTGSIIEWANDQFRELVWLNQRKRKVKTTAVVGESTMTALGIPRNHSVLTHEAEVVHTGRGNVAKNEIEGLVPRWSLRFPISTDGVVKFIGVVSPDFRLEAGDTSAENPRGRRSRRDQRS